VTGMADCKICAKQDDCPFAISSDIICSSYKQRSMSNADRIRAMSDEELAKWMVEVCCIDSPFGCPVFDPAIDKDTSCRTLWLDWLKSPAETEGE